MEGEDAVGCDELIEVDGVVGGGGEVGDMSEEIDEICWGGDIGDVDGLGRTFGFDEPGLQLNVCGDGGWVGVVGTHERGEECLGRVVKGQGVFVEREAWECWS